jgi:nucleoside-diphosphate-sugar epimerase
VAIEKGIEQIVFTSSVACYGYAPPGTGEDGLIAPYNEYGRTKYLAEDVFRDWQGSGQSRSLFIVRPTVIFGEQNRGNVYNLLKQIASGNFVMIGDGKNIKSMAYVGNVAAFIYHAISHPRPSAICNYVDSPDLTMNALVEFSRSVLGKNPKVRIRLPVALGIVLGMGADLASLICRRKLPISAIRVKKFTSSSQFSCAVRAFGFTPPFSMREALEKTIRHEFVERGGGILFFSE